MIINRTKKPIIALAFSSAFASANAAIVNTAPCVNDLAATCAVSITGFAVFGTTLNVSFQPGSFDSVYGLELPFFDQNPLLAQEAAIQMAALLAANQIDGVIGNGSHSDTPDIVRIPYAVWTSGNQMYSEGYFIFQDPMAGPTGWNDSGHYVGQTGFDPAFPGVFAHWAVFTPVPACLFLCRKRAGRCTS